jgi:magnesium transporter
MQESHGHESPPEAEIPDLAGVRAALVARDAERLRTWARREPAALSEYLSELSEDESVVANELLGDELTADVVSELYPEDAAEVLERLAPADAADVLEEMAPDDAADVVEEMDEAEAESVLHEMAAEEQTELRELMAYPTDSAGGLMTPEFVAVRPDWNVAQAIAEIRRVADEAEITHYVYVVDADDRLGGVLSLRDLLLARSNQPVTAVMVPEVARVRADADQEEVARLFGERRFTALPVVDHQNRMLGIITVDDVREVVEEETTEDIERLGGSQPLDEPYLRASVLSLFRKRIVWLLVLFVAEAYTGTVLRFFEDELQEQVALAFFVPLLIGTGGNSASQTVTTLIRAMGVGDVEWSDLGAVVWKEFRTGLLLALAMAAATIVRAELLGVPVAIGAAVALSACAIVIWAASVASLLPFILRRIGVDPAVVSAPMITTLVDGTGLFIYFEIARYLLHL